MAKMAANALLSLSICFISFMFLSIQTVVSSSTDSFVFGGCSQQKYTPNSPFESNLNSLFTSLVNSATYSTYNTYTIIGSSPQDVVYGLYQCRGDLSMPDCATCVARAITKAGSYCPSACGGAVQLQGCYVKYDNATFLGVQDKNMVFKKCGPSVEYDKESEIVGRRDAVMNGLMNGGGSFRVGGSGDVQGLAQCVGDLNADDCRDCLSEAIGRLKTECRAAAYGDLYLGKCYARFSTFGAWDNLAKRHNSPFSLVFWLLMPLLSSSFFLLP
ncbi:hypothetical protein ES288_A08G044100v1 [Gossypium darwinii]|nr:hypothetical protein ES288_A08G044100v1 [Gossypium darwinii]TYI13238.1 hypothetical protein ES332_A08G045300v1 [Gossypium tomentosum]